MRASPRTCPSMRPSRFLHDALMSLRMPDIYPHGVPVASDWKSSWRMPKMETESPPLAATKAANPLHSHVARKDDSAIDPVCGMTVDPHTTRHRSEYQGHTYYFCSSGCREKFAAEPERYLGTTQAP